MGRPPSWEKHRHLTSERLHREATALVDEEGLEALSMRRLAARLGVKAQSLYAHVEGKGHLLEWVHEALLGDVRWPAARGPWRGRLRGLALGLRDACERHPHTVPLLASMLPFSASWRGQLESLLACLARAGFSPRAGADAVESVLLFTAGHALAHHRHRDVAPAWDLVLLSQRPAEAPSPLVRAAAVGQDPRRSFEHGLAALLAGLAASLGPRATRAQRAKA